MIVTLNQVSCQGEDKCDFSTDYCKWKNRESADFQWVRMIASDSATIWQPAVDASGKRSNRLMVHSDIVLCIALKIFQLN